MTKRSVKNTQKNTSIFNENEYENAKLLVLGYPIPSIKPNAFVKEETKTKLNEVRGLK